MTHATLDEMQAALAEVVPALMAAGLSRADIRRVSDETMRRMGDGGSIHAWLDTMCAVSEEVGGRQASRMFKVAVFRYYQRAGGAP